MARLDILVVLALSFALAHTCAASNRLTRQAQASVTPAPTPAPAPAPGPDAGEVASPPLVYFQLHGWLMWAGFGVFMPLGIITSRHLQTATKQWFHIHISLMVLATASVVAGGSIAFNQFGAIPGTPDDDPAALHTRLGTAVFVMACLNFLMGVFRPHKGSKARVAWYCLHFTIGTCAVVFAWYLTYTGMNLYEENFVFSNPDSGLSDLSTLKNWFTVQITILAFTYLLMGRWDHMLGQQHEEAPVDGLKRFGSDHHVSSMAHLQHGTGTGIAPSEIGKSFSLA